MPRFQVRYIAASGTLSDEAIDVPDERAIAAAVGVREPDIISVRQVGVGSASTMAGVSRNHPMARRRGKAFPLHEFCQELSVLLDSGIALYESLETLREKEESVEIAHVLDGLVTLLSRGQTFAQALRRREDVFGGLLVATVEASQRTGQVPAALRRHAAYLAWLRGLRDRLVAATIYPAILIVASLLVMAFLTVFVIPRFAQIYADLGGDLPLMSRSLLRFGLAVGDHPAIVGAAATLIATALVAVWRSVAVRRALLAWIWRLPHVGPRVRLMQLAALYRTLGMLLDAGVPVVPALESCADVVGAGLRAAVALATVRVGEGQRLSDSIESEGLGTPVSLRMVRVGEHSGELGAMLERAATFYDDELARFAEWIGKVVNPVLMLVMGVVIGGVVILMYLPIFQVADQIQ